LVVEWRHYRGVDGSQTTHAAAAVVGLADGDRQSLLPDLVLESDEVG
jgi:hypothetical protein